MGEKRVTKIREHNFPLESGTLVKCMAQKGEVLQIVPILTHTRWRVYWDWNVCEKHFHLWHKRAKGQVRQLQRGYKSLDLVACIILELVHLKRRCWVLRLRSRFYPFSSLALFPTPHVPRKACSCFQKTSLLQY